MTTNSFTIVQHNVLNWNTNKQSLLTNYLQTKPDIILINSHGLKNTEPLKIPGYKCHKVNSTETIYDGSAIAIKHDLQHKLIDTFDTDFLAVEVNTSLGPVIVATTYLPPRRPFLPFTDIYKLINYNIPTYILGDFNCTHTYFGNNTNNTVGRSLAQLINEGKLIHLGPNFPTYIRERSATNPDKIFCNKHSYLNTFCELGNVTSSDHLPIIFKISTRPFNEKIPEIYNVGKANWELFQSILDDKITIKNLNNCTKQELEEETNK